MIEKIDLSKIHIVREIAQITWPVAFGEILSKEQLAYMMNMMYSVEVLEKQLNEGHEFYLFYENEFPLGFMGLELNYKKSNQVKIHKLYILPENQGKGIGEKLIDFASNRCKEENLEILTLNVNRFNKALTFYEKLGFKNVKSEDIEIGNGYLMEDFVMEKKVNEE
ncbi:MAG: GNAT family N-acetyltransferase [Bacteroidota bacterium]